MDTMTTRRGLIRIGTSAAAYAAGAAIVAGGVAGGVALGGEAKGASPSVSPALVLLLAKHTRADARLNRFYEMIYNPAIVRHDAAVCAHRARIAAVPHVTDQGGKSHSGKPIVFASSNPASRRTADEYLKIDRFAPRPDNVWDDTTAAARRFIARDDARNARIAALGEDPSFPARLDEAEAKLGKPLDELDDAILTFPSATITDLHAKLSHFDRMGFAPTDLAQIVRADVARIAGEA